MNNATTLEQARTTSACRATDCACVQPAVDIVETKEEYLLIADMPGVQKEGLDVFLEANELTIHGRRPQTSVQGEWLHRESRELSYRRTFIVDPCIDTTRIAAHIDQGVLTVHLPKAEPVKPRKVQITD